MTATAPGPASSARRRASAAAGLCTVPRGPALRGPALCGPALCGPALACLAAAAGCQYLSVGPAYRGPSVETPAAYLEAKDWKIAEPQDLTARGDWWGVYRDPDLDALMRQVAVSNQNVRLAVARYDQAVALLGVARSGYFPTISADLSATRSQGGNASGGAGGAPATPAATTPGATRTLDRAELSGTWELDVWGRLRRTVESNREAAQASAADLAAALLSAQATLARSYFQLRVTDLELDLLASSMQAYQRALDVTQARYQAGVAQRSDVTQAVTQLENARTQWLDLGITRGTLAHAVAVLLGKPPAALTLPHRSDTPSVPTIPPSLPSALLERRPDIAAAERRVASANAQIGVARAAWFPTLTLNAAGGYESTSFTHLLTLPNRFWSLGPELAMTLLDFGARRNQVRSAEALYDQSVASYRQTVFTAFQDVEDDLLTIRVLRQESLAQRKAADAAAETLRLTLDRYKAGTVDYLNVVSAQNASLTAERNWRDLTNRLLSATVSLLEALGGGFRSDGLPYR